MFNKDEIPKLKASNIMLNENLWVYLFKNKNKTSIFTNTITI